MPTLCLSNTGKVQIHMLTDGGDMMAQAEQASFREINRVILVAVLGHSRLRLLCGTKPINVVTISISRIVDLSRFDERLRT